MNADQQTRAFQAVFRARVAIEEALNGLIEAGSDDTALRLALWQAREEAERYFMAYTSPPMALSGLVGNPRPGR